jgi:type I restriction enzyme R subunit
MEHGHKVEDSDRLAETIIFARNHDHAKFIEQRFNHHYPHYKGHFARVIDNYAKYPDTLIDDFSVINKAPHIAISVDMLDTGIDVPEVANLVFFKPVYSRIKFWQMIGRGTRLCPDLFGPGEDKADFRVFDFCFNFDFFNENPKGIEAGTAAPLGERLFTARVDLLSALQEAPERDADQSLRIALVDHLHGEVRAMNTENFIVRMRREAVERFQERQRWESLTSSDFHVARNELAKLPSEVEADDIESRLFDLLMLRMQLAQLEGDAALFERNRKRVIDIAMALEDKKAIPVVAQELEYIASLQDSGFWEGITLNLLEEVRTRLRGLVPLIDKKNRKIVYTNFKDEVVGIRTGSVMEMPAMTGAQYEKKVKEYLRDHQDHLVIYRLRNNKPLTETDLQGLQQTLIEIGQSDGETLLAELIERSEAPSLAYFVKTMVGMDRQAAQAAFAEFLSDQSLTEKQIRFVEMVIDQLTARGVMDAGALYEQPFTALHVGGPDELFKGKETVVERIFGALKTMEAGLLSRTG